VIRTLINAAGGASLLQVVGFGFSFQVLAALMREMLMDLIQVLNVRADLVAM